MWKLIPPRTRKDGKKIEFYYVRGKYLGIALDNSTGTAERRAAAAILANWKRQAERGEFSQQRTEPRAATFLSAAIGYMQAGGERQYVEAIPRSVWVDVPKNAVEAMPTGGEGVQLGGSW